MKKKWAEKIVEFKGISERIAIAKFSINKKVKLAIFQVYAPTMAATKEERKDFYRTLEECYIRECEQYSIIMGDFNSKIGADHEIKGCTGLYARGQTNKNGFKLGKFCQQLNLKIVSTYFDNPTEERWTWKSPDGNTKNEIDYLITNLSLIHI